VIPLAPVGSGWWDLARSIHSPPVEEIGWPELAQVTAQAWNSLSEADKAQGAILASYAEAGAVDLYGAAYGLPEAISVGNSGWLRGYGPHPPQVLVIVGWDKEGIDHYFSSCTVAGKVVMPYGVENEITYDRPEIVICRKMKLPWLQFWKEARNFA
jgi:hypothetical protein